VIVDAKGDWEDKQWATPGGKLAPHHAFRGLDEDSQRTQWSSMQMQL
jgi:hypothetical protein